MYIVVGKKIAKQIKSLDFDKVKTVDQKRIELIYCDLVLKLINKRYEKNIENTTHIVSIHPFF